MKVESGKLKITRQMTMHSGIKVCSCRKEEIYTAICREAGLGTYTSYIRGTRCTTEIAFFREMSASLQFPYYFGENWPALDECLCDLEWLRFEKLLIIIDDFGRLFSSQAELQSVLQKRVVKYMQVMVEYWETQNKTVEIWLNN